ncbi:MAG: hypothetical protein WCA07_01200 [Gloeobacterales cyanobacterium]
MQRTDQSRLPDYKRYWQPLTFAVSVPGAGRAFRQEASKIVARLTSSPERLG